MTTDPGQTAPTGSEPSPGVAAAALAALAEVTLSVSRQQDLEPLLLRIIGIVRVITRARRALLWEAAAPEGPLVARSVAGDPPVPRDAWPAPRDLGVGAVGWVGLHRQALYVDDVAGDPRILTLDREDAPDEAGLAALPLIVGDDLVGVLSLTLGEKRRLEADERAVLSAFAAQAAIAIHNTRLFREVARRGDRLRKVADLTRAVSSALDLETVLGQLTAAVTDVRPGVMCSLRLVDREVGGYRLLARGGGAAEGQAGIIAFGKGLTHVVAETRRPLFVADTRQDARSVDRAWIERRGLIVYYGVPIEAGEELLGVLGVNFSEGTVLSADEREAISLFADQAAVAIRNARLFGELDARVRELRETQAQLVQAAKLSAVGQLVSGVAHELNNPLSVVIGYGQLLLRRDPPVAMRPGLEAVVAQAQRMAGVVQGLLLFARQRPPERGPVSVGDVLERAVALRATQLGVSNIDLRIERDPDLPPVQGDANQLQQVVLNLLLNAEQAIAEARTGDAIVLRASTRLDRDGPRVLVEVTDNGPGIAAEILPRVFDPFFTTKPVGMGTGLGLSISYGIVEQHGGRIEVDSRPGATTFVVSLPAGEAPAAARPASAVTRRRGKHRGRRALVVGVEPPVADTIAPLLEEDGWQVERAESGPSALARLAQASYDLVVAGAGEGFYREAVAVRAEVARRFLFIADAATGPEARRFVETARLPVLSPPVVAATLHLTVDALARPG